MGVRFAVIGSSTAAGHGADPPEQSWVNRYRTYLKSLDPANNVINLGLGGQQTFHLLPTGYKPPPYRPLPDPERNITKALSFTPSGIIVNAPSNDAAAFYGVEEQLANFDYLMAAGKAAGVPVWICTTQPRIFKAEQIDIQVQLRDAILNRYGRWALNFWDCLATPDHLPRPEYDLGDGTHLNNDGHAQLYEVVVTHNLPALFQQWQTAHRQSAVLQAGSTLLIPELTTGEVFVEVYNAVTELRYRAVTTLPHMVQRPLGPPGTFWVKISGNGYYRLLSWVKTG
ncbi:MAG: SGNH/GDSL hydrolase family protein [Bacteroidetes bacterium]|nr:MAG: SGNH/GDSL hydrolase family protein [Bacteroidota bacterium]